MNTDNIKIKYRVINLFIYTNKWNCLLTKILPYDKLVEPLDIIISIESIDTS